VAFPQRAASCAIGYIIQQWGTVPFISDQLGQDESHEATGSVAKSL
jgi:hypothetical protein